MADVSTVDVSRVVILVRTDSWVGTPIVNSTEDDTIFDTDSIGSSDEKPDSDCDGRDGLGDVVAGDIEDSSGESVRTDVDTNELVTAAVEDNVVLNDTNDSDSSVDSESAFEVIWDVSCRDDNNLDVDNEIVADEVVNGVSSSVSSDVIANDDDDDIDVGEVLADAVEGEVVNGVDLSVSSDAVDVNSNDEGKCVGSEDIDIGDVGEIESKSDEMLDVEPDDVDKRVDEVNKDISDDIESKVDDTGSVESDDVGCKVDKTEDKVSDGIESEVDGIEDVESVDIDCEVNEVGKEVSADTASEVGNVGCIKSDDINCKVDEIDDEVSGDVDVVVDDVAISFIAKFHKGAE
ncbi:hypothetical protein FVEG_05751 [Fusarium verticillioides 7600]|uniref:Uncharacterized protein n=1 Tax=Gibberella moniliformis (strain M3125 / FGSC 7600) TaxID=334819 RepID=W7MB01_GIBM7|nr:hypothetical protein FVEG_05751 [Fusarium verticillioides 7600]EWG44760.1 hypothetical protein FVEG_05751 [Fusarium verticillioides 7600]